VRKELETVLFDRLLRSEEARGLLREYLIVRGAIRVSHQDARFQLSDDLDARTRARIEQILETIEADEVPASVSEAGFLADRGPVRNATMAGRMKRWVLRPSVAMLALLLAIGTTWFVTHSTDERMASLHAPQPAAPSQAPTAQSAPTVSAPTATVTTPEAPREIPVTNGAKPHAANRNVVTTHGRAVTPSIAQNAPATQSVKETEQASVQTENPSDIMISRRYSKAINAAEKHEIVVSGHDRL